MFSATKDPQGSSVTHSVSSQTHQESMRSHLRFNNYAFWRLSHPETRFWELLRALPLKLGMKKKKSNFSNQSLRKFNFNHRCLLSPAHLHLSRA